LDDTLLMNAYAELRALLADPSVPEGVISACLRLSECPTKLFVMVGLPKSHLGQMTKVVALSLPISSVNS
jgi:hypothetical protein